MSQAMQGLESGLMTSYLARESEEHLDSYIGAWYQVLKGSEPGTEAKGSLSFI